MGNMLTVMSYYPKLTFTQPSPLPKYLMQQKPYCCGSNPKRADAHQMLPDWEVRKKMDLQLLRTRRGSICCYWSQRKNATAFHDSRHLLTKAYPLQANIQNALKNALWKAASSFYHFSGSGDASTSLPRSVQQEMSSLSRAGVLVPGSTRETDRSWKAASCVMSTPIFWTMNLILFSADIIWASLTITQLCTFQRVLFQSLGLMILR